MSFFNSMDVSASGLTAQNLRLDIIAENIANVNTTRSEDGTPYKAKTVVFEEMGGTQKPFNDYFSDAVQYDNRGHGVRVSSIEKDNTPGAIVYDPYHPDADAEGYVVQSNVNIVKEMVNMISASRSYEANITSMNTTKAMINKTLEIGRG